MSSSKSNVILANKRKDKKSFSFQSSNDGLISISMATTLVIAVSTAMMENVYAEDISTMDTLVIEESKSTVKPDANPYAEPDAPYKAKRLSDSRRTRDIADTPQTMTVMTKDLILDSGKTELKDILSAQTGITLGTGEGGNSFGDRYIIRGYEARNDVFTDGLRDPGLITRETFALEQVEISKGPSSTFAGRGSTGGAINTVTKKANLDDDFTTVSGGLGTDSYQRYTLDSNKVINDKLAVRLNATYSQADVPDRSPADEQRQGALLSAVFQATDNLNIAADYYYFRSDDKTDPGVQLDRSTGIIDKNIQNIGQSGLDFHESDADIFTVKVDYQVNENLRVENKTRLGQTQNAFIISGYHDRFDAGIRPFNAWQENDYFGNQTNLMFDTVIWGQQHNFIYGVEYAKEEVNSGGYTVATDASVPMIDPHNPNNNSWSGTITKSNNLNELELTTISTYIMDTITLTEDWEVFAGLRYDHFDYDLFSAATSGRRGPIPEQTYQYSDSFVNGHIGLVFSPWEKGNVYTSYSTSSNINGGESDSGSNCGYGGLCTDTNGNYNADPEQSENIELGTKWNLNDGNLLLTAALFQTTKDDVIEGSTNSYAPEGNLNTGKNRVRGIELGLSGNLTPKLSGQFGVAVMSSDTLESFDPLNIGKAKANFADKSISAQLRYKMTSKFAFGGNFTYSSEILGGQPDAGSANDTTIRVPGYAVFDVFADYKVNKNVGIRANIQNLTDKDYYTALYRGGDIIYVGDARSANVTLTYKY